MHVVARAPGKLIVLGEYAVLEGAPALALAVDRRCRASVGPSPDSRCRLVTVADERREYAFACGAPSGVALVDRVRGSSPSLPAWQAELDSSALHAGRVKLGLGSSAAALCAFAAAFERFARAGGAQGPPLDLERLVGMHRALQGGAGSGVDVAATVTGGLVRYHLEAGGRPRVSSVPLPNGVGFAGIFAGSSASTPDFLARFHTWKAGSPDRAGDVLDALRRTAEAGCTAAEAGDPQGLLAAVTEYGERLEMLGSAMGAEVVTARHLEIRREADRHGVAYKVSGAGGGDVGIALAADAEALQAFQRAVESKRYRVIELRTDPHGLSIEEHRSER